MWVTACLPACLDCWLLPGCREDDVGAHGAMAVAVDAAPRMTNALMALRRRPTSLAGAGAVRRGERA